MEQENEKRLYWEQDHLEYPACTMYQMLERIADDFYFARSLKLIRHIFATPELLEQPLGKPSGFL